jgi:hypothetical protein
VPKPKKVKVLTHGPRPHSIKRTTAIPDTNRIEIVEQTEALPMASETIPTATVEASAGPVEESEIKSSKVKEHSKLLSPPTTTELPKLTTVATTTMTPKKRRMTSVLKSTKMPTPATIEASDDKIEDVREVAVASASSIHVEARPLGAKPVEMVKESLPGKPTSHVPEVPSQGDLDYIVRHASGKKLSEEQIAEVQHYAKDLKYTRGVAEPPKLLGPHAPALVSKTSYGYACVLDNLTGSVRVSRGPRIIHLQPRSQD